MTPASSAVTPFAWVQACMLQATRQRRAWCPLGDMPVCLQRSWVCTAGDLMLGLGRLCFITMPSNWCIIPSAGATLSSHSTACSPRWQAVSLPLGVWGLLSTPPHLLAVRSSCAPHTLAVAVGAAPLGCYCSISTSMPVCSEEAGHASVHGLLGWSTADTCVTRCCSPQAGWCVGSGTPFWRVCAGTEARQHRGGATPTAPHLCGRRGAGVLLGCLCT
jgi:hypothetical protein